MTARYKVWRAMHRGKVVHASNFHGWVTIWKIAWMEKRYSGMRPYLCNWCNDYRKGNTNNLHWHIGHPGKKYREKHPEETLKGRVWFYWHKNFVWKLWRLRTLIRNPDHSYTVKGKKTRNIWKVLK